MSKFTEVREKLLANRPNLSDSTLRTYLSAYRVLLRTLKTDPEDLESLFSEPLVLDVLDPLPINSRKTKLSALVNLCDAYGKPCESFRKKMLDDAQEVKEQLQTQEKNSKQEASWVSWPDVIKKREQLKKEVAPLWSKDEWSSGDLQRLQDYVIVSLYSYIPPRRLKDYSEALLYNYKTDQDNYFLEARKELVFNDFKTVSTFGKQVVEVPKELLTVLKKWKKIVSPSGPWLLRDSKNNKLSVSGLNQRINTIFGKKVGVNGLRHSYVSDLLKDAPKLSDLKKSADAMGHSLDTQQEYRKL
jgi:integrase